MNKLIVKVYYGWWQHRKLKGNARIWYKMTGKISDLYKHINSFRNTTDLELIRQLINQHKRIIERSTLERDRLINSMIFLPDYIAEQKKIKQENEQREKANKEMTDLALKYFGQPLYDERHLP